MVKSPKNDRECPSFQKGARMEELSQSKYRRILDIYMRLLDGDTISKSTEAARFSVNERSIQRDIDDIRAFLAEKSMESGETYDVIYDRSKKAYRLSSSARQHFSNGEVLAVCKILLESRAFTAEEMNSLIEKILQDCVPKSDARQITELVLSEKHYYIPPHHGQPIVDRLWEIGVAVREQKFMLVEYTKLDGSTVQRLLKPVGIMFSEYYFYLTAFIESIDRKKEFEVEDDLYPTIYRIDRIKGFKVLEERFEVPYRNKFQEGEFRKRVQFMYGGRLEHIKFRYTGPSIEAVLDRLPTAEAAPQPDGSWLVSAEVFGKGIDMWLRSQGDHIQPLEDSHT